MSLDNDCPKPDDIHNLFVEKYRPTQLEDLASQSYGVKSLLSVVRSGAMPHLLLHGPPGTGKTTAAHAATWQLFGPLKNHRVIELNASDARTISVVRGRIKSFANKSVRYANAKDSKGNPVPPYNVIILDEADSMTTQAQDALLRVMETSSETTRFIITCNYISRVSIAIASRCLTICFSALSERDVQTRLEAICASENALVHKKHAPTKMDDARVKTQTGDAQIQTQVVAAQVAALSGGDLRKAINALQHVLQTSNFSSTSNSEQTVCAINNDYSNFSDAAAANDVAPFLTAVAACDFQQLRAAVEDAFRSGIMPIKFVAGVASALGHYSPDSGYSLGTIAQAALATECAAVDRALRAGCDSRIQFLHMGMRAIYAQMHKKSAPTLH
jgi:DNA polymerase III delta prime subunit